MENNHPFKPGKELSFRTVVAVRKALFDVLQRFSEQQTFCLDLSEVNMCDSAGLAFLIEAKKRCKQSNILLELKGMTSEIEALVEFCGVKSILEAKDDATV